MGYMDLLKILDENEFDVPTMQPYHPLESNQEQAVQPAQNILGDILGKNQETATQNLMSGASRGAGDMIQTAEQEAREAASANQAFQAQRQSQMNSTEQQASQELARQQQEQAQGAGLFGKLLGLALPLITGGLGAGASAGVTGASGATLSNALQGTLLDPMKKTFFPMR